MLVTCISHYTSQVETEGATELRSLLMDGLLVSRYSYNFFCTLHSPYTDLHSVWDGYFIAQALRNLPRNYTHALPSGATVVDVESHLRGTIYDPYVRRIMFEGFGAPSHPGRFLSTYQSWLTCPQTSTPSLSETFQTLLGFGKAGAGSDWDDDYLCPYAWAKDLQKLNCELPVWPKELDEPPYNHASSDSLDNYSHKHHAHHIHEGENELLEIFYEMDALTGRPPLPHPGVFELDTPEYAGRIRSEWLVERLLAMGGIRLAGLLNGLFLNPDELVNTSPNIPVFPL